jgi:N utilization substance protein B
MQCIYALSQTREESLDGQKKFLKGSIENMYVLYLLQLSLFTELHKLAEKHVLHDEKKYLSDEKTNWRNPRKFIDNLLLLQLQSNTLLKEQLEKRKLKNWYLNEEYVKIVYRDLVDSDLYKTYMKEEGRSFEKDREFLTEAFKQIIAPNEKIYEYFEDDRLTWVDDIPLVNTFLLKLMRKAAHDTPASYFLPELLKDQADLDFANELLTKTLLKDGEWEKEVEGNTPNWDKERIAEIDFILLKMAICELLSFSSIPEKVTINEYLEIAKEYSTPKSSIFINGILDKLVKEYKESGKMRKSGRGLL